MTAYPAWTPAPRPGIVPLHPFGFGTILGTSFTALRQNPKVLLGFALCVQIAAYVVVLLATAGVAVASFSRLDTVPVGGDEYDAILAGSVAATAVTALVLSLATGALSVIVQGIVVGQVASAVVAEKPALRDIWRRVRPVAWRLVGYSFLLGGAAVLAVAIVGALIFAIGVALLPVAVLLGILVFLGAIPLSLWLSTKLFVVPAAIILEHESVRGAIVRSWRLTRTRFWSTLGVLVIISLAFGTLAQVVSIPLSLLSSGTSSIFSPTGDPAPGAIIAFVTTTLLGQMLILVIQCVALIVQSTSAALVYIDARMRHEGLDLDLREYVERRDAGATDLPDPYRVHVGRTIEPRWAPPGSAPQGYAPQGYAPQGYAAQGYAPQGSPPPAGYAAPSADHPAPGQAPAYGSPAPTSPAQPTAPPSPSAPAADAPPTQWTAPGEGS